MRDPRIIPGSCSHYRACADGWIWSEFVRGSKAFGPWRRLKAAVNRAGYRVVQVRDDRGVASHRLVHRLVAFAFIGPPQEGQECRHLDGNKLNNRPDNLAWGTRKENLTDCLSHGTLRGRPGHWNIGADNPGAKLTEEQVRMVRRLAAQGRPFKAIASEFKVHPSTIANAVRGLSYSEVL